MNDQIPGNDPEQNHLTTMKTLQIAAEFGFIIAIPLVIFSLGGNWLAERYQNRLFLVGALVLALLLSTIWLYYKILKIYEELTNK